jgi:hypothetical protein
VRRRSRQLLCCTLRSISCLSRYPP